MGQGIGVEYIVALVLIVIGATLSYLNPKASLVAVVLGLIAVMFSSLSFAGFAGFIFVIALMNLASLNLMKNNQIRGVDYALVGMMALATFFVFTATDVSLILASFVLVSTPTYILILLDEKKIKVDPGMKYVVFMVLATILFIVGALLLVYNSNYASRAMYIVGFTMMILGLSLEVGAAPLHGWVPDVFSSADAVPVSIIASIAKIVPFVAAYRILLMTSTPVIKEAVVIALAIAVISMFAGNIGALTTGDIRKVLAYSSIANMGYILPTTALVAFPKYFPLALAGALLQLTMNAVGKVGFFSGVKSEGIMKHMAYLLSLSFIGLPPLLGFWSKLFIVLSLVYAGYVWVAILMVLNSSISIPYYLRLAREIGIGWKLNLVNVIVLVAVIVVFITLYPPNWFVDVADRIYAMMISGGV